MYLRESLQWSTSPLPWIFRWIASVWVQSQCTNSLKVFVHYFFYSTDIAPKLLQLLSGWIWKVKCIPCSNDLLGLVLFQFISTTFGYFCLTILYFQLFLLLLSIFLYFCKAPPWFSGLGCTWGLLELSWASLGCVLDALGGVLAALGALLGRSWDALGPSWDLLEAS